MAVEATNSVDAGGAVEAGGAGTVVDVLRAHGAVPAVDADAGIATDDVGARGSVLADRRPLGALVDVLLAITAGVGGRAPARVPVDAVHARAAVLALVRRAVVDVLLAVQSTKPWKKK